jgi:hypothetical protein
MRYVPLAASAILALVTSGGATALHAQELGFRALQVRSADLHNPLGIAASVSFSNGEGTGVRLGYSIARGTERGPGTVGCHWPVLEPCGIENVRREGIIHGVELARPTRAAGGERARLLVVPAIRIVRVEHAALGLGSGRGSSHRQMLWGGDLGVESRIGAGEGSRTVLVLAASLGGLLAFHPPLHADGAYWSRLPTGRIEVGFEGPLRRRGRE